MEHFTSVTKLRLFLEIERKANHTIAFIPTMGALHEGHLSLIKLGKKYADTTVCSVYVNPTQFNNADDLKKYPRNIEKDAGLLDSVGCNVLFTPSNEEIYPEGLDTEVHLDLGNLDTVMEGQFRPGHFKGMLQVVKRLLESVNPNFLIMGQKDFQQFSLVQYMITQFQLPVKLIIGPTLREPDGLAMSSRNQRLGKEERKNAISIYQCLSEIKNKLGSSSTEILQENATTALKTAGLKPEYVDIVDGQTLQKVTNPDQHEYVVACIAAWAGEVRLIDNLILKGKLD